jgi:hypothetical protein
MRGIMSSPLTPSKWIAFLLINVIVTAGTLFLFSRVLSREPATFVPQPAAQGTAMAAVVDASTNTSASLPVNPATEAVVSNTTEPAADSAVKTAPIAAVDATPTRAAPSVAAATGLIKVRISAVQFAGQRTRESVSILNEGDQVDLTGWSVVAPNGESYAFKDFVLFRDSFITLYSTNGSDSPTSLFWNKGEAMWKRGDTVTLKQGDTVVATFAIK